MFVKTLKQRLQQMNKKEALSLLGKCLFLGLLPLLVSVITCVSQGYSIGQVSLANSEWNDELFYFKQVEAILSHGYPQGYFGFNESHALKYSFAAWSPVLVWPWLLYGLLFGWNLLSPIWCNIWLLCITMVLFVLLVRPKWKQCGLIAILFCAFTPFARYMLCGMPEIICFSMVIVYLAVLYSELEQHKNWKLFTLLFMAVVMTWMRPYLILFLLFPMGIWIRRKKWLAMGGSVVILGITGAVYYAINHYLGAEYFTPLFKTEWIDPFFQGHILTGIRGILVRIYYEGKNFFAITKQGLISGLAEGAFFNCYLLTMFLLAMQAVLEFGKLRFEKRKFRLGATGEGAEAGASIEEKTSTESEIAAEKKTSVESKKIIGHSWKTENESASRLVPEELSEKWRRMTNQILLNGYLAFCFFAMWMALLLMYKMKEGSKHLLTFIVMGLFAVCLMETKFYKKTMVMAALFVFLFWVKGYQPYDYQVPFVTEERAAQMDYWSDNFTQNLQLSMENVPNYDNVVIWTFKDGDVLTDWQVLYALPSGFGISCCYSDYVMDHLDHLQSKYLLIPTGGELQEACEAAGLPMIGDDGRACIYSTRNAYQEEKEALQPEVDAFTGGNYEAFFLAQDDWNTLEAEDFLTYRGLNTYVFFNMFDQQSELKWICKQLEQAELPLQMGFMELNPEKISADQATKQVQGLLDAQPMKLSILFPAPALDYWQGLGDECEDVLAKYQQLLEALQQLDRVQIFFTADQEWLIGNMDNYVVQADVIGEGAAEKVELSGENVNAIEESASESGKPELNAESATSSIITWNKEVMHNMLISMVCDGKYDVTNADASAVIDALRGIIMNAKTSITYAKEYKEVPMEMSSKDSLYVMLGDSIFGNYTDSTSIPKVMSSYGGMEVINCGYGGLCMTAVDDAQSVQDVLDALVTGDSSKLPEVPAKQGVTTVQKLLQQQNDKSVTFFLSYGINDYIGGRKLLSDEDPMDIHSYAGSLCTAIERLQDFRPDAKIVLCTPTGIETFEGGTLDQSAKGYILQDYRDMVLAIGQEYDLQVLDLYDILPFGKVAGVLSDGVHPNENGRYLMALKILEEMR